MKPRRRAKKIMDKFRFHFWIISHLVEVQITSLCKMFSYFKGPEGKSYCLQS